jgi:hypothetical protein
MPVIEFSSSFPFVADPMHVLILYPVLALSRLKDLSWAAALKSGSGVVARCLYAEEVIGDFETARSGCFRNWYSRSWTARVSWVAIFSERGLIAGWNRCYGIARWFRSVKLSLSVTGIGDRLRATIFLDLSLIFGIAVSSEASNIYFYVFPASLAWFLFRIHPRACSRNSRCDRTDPWVVFGRNVQVYSSSNCFLS